MTRTRRSSGTAAQRRRRRSMSYDGGLSRADDKGAPTFEEIGQRVEDAANAVAKFVQFGKNPEVLLRIRKQFNIKIPIVPDVCITAGTDVPLMKRATDSPFGAEIGRYKPNLQWKVTDSWFQGDLNLDTRQHTVYYEKMFDLDAVQLKVSANYDYKDYEPYIGFQFITSQGVTSPSTENGFSIKKKVEIKDSAHLKLEADIEASLKLGATRMGGKKKLETAPATVDVQVVTLDLLLR